MMTHDRAIRETGPSLAAGAPGYGAALAELIFNGRTPAGQPDLIVRARSTADVQAAVHRARGLGLKISARGSGHNWSGIARQDGMVIDVSHLRDMRIDATARIAEVGPGVRNSELAAALAAAGLAFPLGHCATVAMSGYLLGGGFGWNSGAWGPACRSVLAAELVTADGTAQWIDAQTAPDLFWALRGAGPTFPGIVTRYRLALQPHPAEIVSEIRVYPLDRADEVRRWAQGVMAVAPGFVEFTLAMHSAPPHLSGRARKVVSAVITVFAPDNASGAEMLAGAALWAPADPFEVVGPMPTPFETLYGMIGSFFPESGRFGVDAVWSAEARKLVAGLSGLIDAAPSAQSFALAVVLPPGSSEIGGAFSSCFGMPGEVFGCIYGIWKEATEDEVNLSWLREGVDQMTGAIIGHYVGEADLARPGRLQASFAPKSWARLSMIRGLWDPTGLFTAAPPRETARSPAASAA